MIKSRGINFLKGDFVVTFFFFYFIFFLLWKTRKAEIREKERFEYAKADLDKTFFF